MPVVVVTTSITAPIERVFDLARCIDLHTESLNDTGERAVAGVTSGLIGPDESVTWRARHFGVWQQLTSQITAYDRPTYFRDSQVRGAFKRFDHHHLFALEGQRTLVIDIFDYAAPLGVLGMLADQLFLMRYMRNLLNRRNLIIKRVAETEAWQRFLNEAPDDENGRADPPPSAARHRLRALDDLLQ